MNRLTLLLILYSMTAMAQITKEQGTSGKWMFLKVDSTKNNYLLVKQQSSFGDTLFVSPALMRDILNQASRKQKPNQVTGHRIILNKGANSGYLLIRRENSLSDTLLLSEYAIGEMFDKYFKENPQRKTGFQLIVDQDAFVSRFNEDRDYTMGLQATLSGRRKKAVFVKKLFSLTDDDIQMKNWAGTFSFSGFTPYHLEYNYVDRTDRPYAALGSISSSGMYSFKEKKLVGDLLKRQFFRSTAVFGFMGKGTSQKAKFIQTAVHSGQRALADDTADARPNPQGWEFAIAAQSSFAPVFNYNADYANEFEYELIQSNEVFTPLKLMLKPGVGFAAGTLYDNLNAGIQGQFGFFSTSIFSGNNDGAIFDAIKTKAPWFELSLTGEWFGQAWAHNSTLNGILFNRSGDVYHIDYNRMERFTSYYSYGMEISYKRQVSLGYSKVVRSNVIKDIQREQVFGRFVLRVGI